MRIGVLTAGGDCPGLNAAIRALVRTASSEYDSPVLGFQDGWSGLVNDRAVPLFDDESIDRILLRGGTILGTGRLNPDILTASLPEIRRTLERHALDALVAIGGDGTLKAARWLTENGVPVVGVPKTIDNDVGGTDYTFGFDTAVSIASDAIDRLHTTAESHERVMLVEVMGRHAGWIALHAGLASGAHMIVIPEVPFDIDHVCKLMKRRFQMGEAYGICVVAEGATPVEGSGMTLREGGIDQFGHEVFTGVADQMGTAIKERMNRDVRTTVLGHIQRGGTPTAYDRVLATRFGVHAARAVHRGDFGQIVALRGESIEMVPVEDAVAVLKTVPEDRYREASCLFG
ncbi:ATP-dependent 6-phosphofructokinase [Dietzia sp. ANT_WB102]|uniref:ATP-dependent 6-phosphofructokinase n=1 Tax=Dietzia sp. ANT_WB102 TaxID=2597345 RepID=UPI0011EE88D0|nr:ATP-dependent 6-phosphofructokinase [Dietzia sp. ANT_WB102]KAA0919479.1 6-phosphofructokinase [Dietzia sp. ANT_WB102]